MGDLIGGLVGCGRFAQNHLHAWREVEGARLGAVCDLDLSRAEEAAGRFEIQSAYRKAENMLDEEPLDFVDVVTGPESNGAIARAAAARGVPVICQKPLAEQLDEARSIVRTCEAAGIPLMVHDNFRWQRPMRHLKEVSERLGELFFGRLEFRGSREVFERQPYLADQERLIVLDLGLHLLDLSRFFFGEIERVSCQTQQIGTELAGEDVATMLLRSNVGASIVIEISYASRLGEQHPRQTLVLLEGTRGSARLDTGYSVRTIREDRVHTETVAPEPHSWASEPGLAIKDSVVTVQQHWIDCLRTGNQPETSGRDHLQTLQLVFAAYESAEEGW